MRGWLATSETEWTEWPTGLTGRPIAHIRCCPLIEVPIALAACGWLWQSLSLQRDRAIQELPAS